jgi:cytochrome P450
VTVPAEVLPGSLAEVPPTDGAVWLTPGEWPPVTDFLFRAREPFRAPPQPGGFSPVVVTRYSDVEPMLVDETGLWLRSIPARVIPEAARDCVVDASWMLDGEEHDKLRDAIGAVNYGSTSKAREFTRDLTRQLLQALMREDPPWNLVRLIDEVSIRLIIEHTLQAPMLLPYATRMRQLTRFRAPARTDDGTDVFAYFKTFRRHEMEDILGLVADHPGQLPEGGLARHLVDLTQMTDPESGMPYMTRKQLISQLAMLLTSYESSQAATAGLIGMLLGHGLFDQARQFAATPDGMANLVREAGRRAFSFPINMFTAGRPATLGRHDIAEGEPVIISYQAANMDPARFGDGSYGFDPRIRRPPHIAFGKGPHLCQGKRAAEGLAADVIREIVNGLPPGTRLGHGGQVLQEVASISWAVAALPAIPRGEPLRRSA